MTRKSASPPQPSSIVPRPPAFSAQQAQALIASVRSAPVANLDHADSLRALLEQFAAWYNQLPAEFKAVLQPEKTSG